MTEGPLSALAASALDAPSAIHPLVRSSFAPAPGARLGENDLASDDSAWTGLYVPPADVDEYEGVARLLRSFELDTLPLGAPGPPRGDENDQFAQSDQFAASPPRLRLLSREPQKRKPSDPPPPAAPQSVGPAPDIAGEPAIVETPNEQPDAAVGVQRASDVTPNEPAAPTHDAEIADQAVNAPPASEATSWRLGDQVVNARPADETPDVPRADETSDARPAPADARPAPNVLHADRPERVEATQPAPDATRAQTNHEPVPLPAADVASNARTSDDVLGARLADRASGVPGADDPGDVGARQAPHTNVHGAELPIAQRMDRPADAQRADQRAEVQRVDQPADVHIEGRSAGVPPIAGAEVANVLKETPERVADRADEPASKPAADASIAERAIESDRVSPSRRPEDRSTLPQTDDPSRVTAGIRETIAPEMTGAAALPHDGSYDEAVPAVTGIDRVAQSAEPVGTHPARLEPQENIDDIRLDAVRASEAEGGSPTPTAVSPDDVGPPAGIQHDDGPQRPNARAESPGGAPDSPSTSRRDRPPPVSLEQTEPTVAPQQLEPTVAPQALEPTEHPFTGRTSPYIGEEPVQQAGLRSGEAPSRAESDERSAHQAAFAPGAEPLRRDLEPAGQPTNAEPIMQPIDRAAVVEPRDVSPVAPTFEAERSTDREQSTSLDQSTYPDRSIEREQSSAQSVPNAAHSIAGPHTTVPHSPPSAPSASESRARRRMNDEVTDPHPESEARAVRSERTPADSAQPREAIRGLFGATPSRIEDEESAAAALGITESDETRATIDVRPVLPLQSTAEPRDVAPAESAIGMRGDASVEPAVDFRHVSSVRSSGDSEDSTAVPPGSDVRRVSPVESAVERPDGPPVYESVDARHVPLVERSAESTRVSSIEPALASQDIGAVEAAVDAAHVPLQETDHVHRARLVDSSVERRDVSSVERAADTPHVAPVERAVETARLAPVEAAIETRALSAVEGADEVPDVPLVEGSIEPRRVSSVEPAAEAPHRAFQELAVEAAHVPPAEPAIERGRVPAVERPDEVRGVPLVEPSNESRRVSSAEPEAETGHAAPVEAVVEPGRIGVVERGDEVRHVPLVEPSIESRNVSSAEPAPDARHGASAEFPVEPAHVPLVRSIVEPRSVPAAEGRDDIRRAPLVEPPVESRHVSPAEHAAESRHASPAKAAVESAKAAVESVKAAVKSIESAVESVDAAEAAGVPAVEAANKVRPVPLVEPTVESRRVSAEERAVGHQRDTSVNAPADPRRVVSADRADDVRYGPAVAPSVGSQHVPFVETAAASRPGARADAGIELRGVPVSQPGVGARYVPRVEPPVQSGPFSEPPAESWGVSSAESRGISSVERAAEPQDIALVEPAIGSRRVPAVEPQAEAGRTPLVDTAGSSHVRPAEPAVGHRGVPPADVSFERGASRAATAADAARPHVAAITLLEAEPAPHSEQRSVAAVRVENVETASLLAADAGVAPIEPARTVGLESSALPDQRSAASALSSETRGQHVRRAGERPDEPSRYVAPAQARSEPIERSEPSVQLERAFSVSAESVFEPDVSRQTSAGDITSAASDRTPRPIAVSPIVPSTAGSITPPGRDARRTRDSSATPDTLVDRVSTVRGAETITADAVRGIGNRVVEHPMTTGAGVTIASDISRPVTVPAIAPSAPLDGERQDSQISPVRATSETLPPVDEPLHVDVAAVLERFAERDVAQAVEPSPPRPRFGTSAETAPRIVARTTQREPFTDGSAGVARPAVRASMSTEPPNAAAAPFAGVTAPMAPGVVPVPGLPSAARVVSPLPAIEPAGTESFGTERVGVEPFGIEPFGVERFGVERFGIEPFGVEATGSLNAIPSAGDPFASSSDTSAGRSDALTPAAETFAPAAIAFARVPTSFSPPTDVRSPAPVPITPVAAAAIVSSPAAEGLEPPPRSPLPQPVPQTANGRRRAELEALASADAVVEPVAKSAPPVRTPAAPAERTIRVAIDRIEIAPPASPPPARVRKRPMPRMTLDRYGERRT